jgi:hypothetical protein
MTRAWFRSCRSGGALVGIVLLAAAQPVLAAEVEMPNRKAGLWEMKMVSAATPTLTMQHCTDEATDKRMRTSYSPLAKEVCAKNEVQKTATGYVTDTVCDLGGVKMNSHAEITGDFNSAYTVKTIAQQQGGPSGGPRQTEMTLEAKWLGPCKPDQKPGDIMMPGGIKMNVRDLEKIKGLLPK